MINIKSKTQGFFPSLYMALHTYGDNGNKITKQMSFHGLWDKDQYVMHVSKKFEDVKEGTQLKMTIRYNSELYKD